MASRDQSIEPWPPSRVLQSYTCSEVLRNCLLAIQSGSATRVTVFFYGAIGDPRRIGIVQSTCLQ